MQTNFIPIVFVTTSPCRAAVSGRGKASAVAGIACGAEAAAVRAEAVLCCSAGDAHRRLIPLISLSTSASKSRPERTSMACRYVRSRSPSGKSATVGILTRPSNTGITGTPRDNAASISMRTKSAGSSRRRFPSSERAPSQPRPTIASSMSHCETASLRCLRKSRPGGIVSTSINTAPSPKYAASLR